MAKRKNKNNEAPKLSALCEDFVGFSAVCKDDDGSIQRFTHYIRTPFDANEDVERETFRGRPERLIGHADHDALASAYAILRDAEERKFIDVQEITFTTTMVAERRGCNELCDDGSHWLATTLPQFVRWEGRSYLTPTSTTVAISLDAYHASGCNSNEEALEFAESLLAQALYVKCHTTNEILFLPRQFANGETRMLRCFSDPTYLNHALRDVFFFTLDN